MSKKERLKDAFEHLNQIQEQQYQEFKQSIEEVAAILKPVNRKMDFYRATDNKNMLQRLQKEDGSSPLVNFLLRRLENTFNEFLGPLDFYGDEEED